VNYHCIPIIVYNWFGDCFLFTDSIQIFHSSCSNICADELRDVGFRHQWRSLLWEGGQWIPYRLVR